MIATISQKTNKPLCSNIDLDPMCNTWSLHIYPNYYKKRFTFLFSPYIRMSGKKFRERKNQKEWLLEKQKSI